MIKPGTKIAAARLFVALPLLAASAATSAQSGAARPYPSQPIRLVVPFSIGGATDIIARTAGDKLARAVGQAVVIDNRPGAGSTLGAAEVAKAPADGYTLLFITPTHLIGPVLYKSLPYDPITSFRPVIRLAGGGLAMTVNPGVKAANVKEFISMANAQPGKIHYGSSGNGSTQHLAGRMFETLAGTTLTHVPYKGSAQVTTDLIGGVTQVSFMGVTNALPHLRSGRLRALAVTSATRREELPDVPTMEQAGVPGYVLSSWAGLVAPAGTPASLVNRVHDEIDKGMRSPDAVKSLRDSGSELMLAAPQEFAKYLQTESRKWLDLARNSNITIE